MALIPEAISFSIIAGVDPRVGLFSSFTMAVTIAASPSSLVRFRTKAPMSFGLCLYIAGQLMLILSPRNTVVPLIVYTLLDAVAFALVYPRKELMASVFVDRQERARIVALLTTLMIAISMPFGGIAGALSKLDGRLPFALSITLYLTALVVIVTMRENPSAEDEEAEGDTAVA